LKIETSAPNVHVTVQLFRPNGTLAGAGVLTSNSPEGYLSGYGQGYYTVVYIV